MENDAVLPAARLRELAHGVQQQLPDRRAPHKFHFARRNAKSSRIYAISLAGPRGIARSPLM
jgi:hypothetical protein